MDEEPAAHILDATYLALCEHGYADLTLQDVAAEADVSTASIHYHYESKDQLFVSVLDMLTDRLTEQLSEVAGGSPREDLRATLELLLGGDSASRREFRTAMLELSAQAPYDEDLAERLVEFDESLYERFRDIFERGETAGSFARGIDPSLAAELVTAAVTGAQSRHAAVGRSPDRLHAALTEYVEAETGGDGSAEVSQ